MKKKKVVIKDLENVWWLDDSERRREKVWKSLGEGNFENGIKEVFLFVDFLRKEARWCNDIIAVLIKGIKEDKLQDEVDSWSSIINIKN